MTTLGRKCGVSLTDEIKYERLRGPTKRTKMCKKIEENKMPQFRRRKRRGKARGGGTRCWGKRRKWGRSFSNNDILLNGKRNQAKTLIL